MSKTTPVRWWRDDATRYESRPLFGVYRTQPEAARWAFELVAPLDPEDTATLQRLQDASSPEALAAAFALPLEATQPSGSWDLHGGAADPIGDFLRGCAAFTGRGRR